MMTRFTRSLTFLLFSFFVVKHSLAQRDLFIGIKGGISIPNLKASGDNPVSKGWSSRLGPYAGIIADLMIGEKISIQQELNYSSQGGKKNGTQAIPTKPFAEYFPPGIPVPPYVYATYKSEIKLNYLEYALMLKGHFGLSDYLSFFVNGGPYAGYLLSAKNETSGNSNIYLDENLTQPYLPQAVSFDGNQDIENDLTKFNFGIQIGLGLSLAVSERSKLNLTGGGNYGLIPIQKDESNGKNNTGAATVTLGYVVRL